MKLTVKADASIVEFKEQAPLNEQQRELATRYISVALSIARQFSRSWKWLQDDLEATALLALVECARNFDPSYNVKFSTFAKHRIHGSLINFRKRFVQAHKRKLAHDSESQELWFSVKPNSNLNQSEISDLELNSAKQDRTDRSIIAYEIRDDLEAKLKALPSIHQQVMCEVYLNHLNLKETALKIGYSVSRVFAIHRESIQILRENVEYLNRFHADN